MFVEGHFKCTVAENYAFIAIKKIVGRDVLVYYPNFNERSKIQKCSLGE